MEEEEEEVELVLGHLTINMGAVVAPEEEGTVVAFTAVVGKCSSILGRKKGLAVVDSGPLVPTNSSVSTAVVRVVSSVFEGG